MWKNDFHGRVARIQPFISHKNHKQKKFAENHLQGVSEFWKTVLFPDRSKYNVFGSDGHNYVWQEPGEELWGASAPLWLQDGDGPPSHRLPYFRGFLRTGNVPQEKHGNRVTATGRTTETGRK
jgi:hypothetical protein